MNNGCLIAQISDPHIKAEGRLSYRRVDTQRALRDAIALLNRLAPRVDALLVSGDLVDFGRAEEYAALEELLADLAMPCYLIPGNHDDRRHLKERFAEHAYLHQHDEFVQWVVDDFPVRLIGLDSSVPGQPHGELCLERLTWLDEALRQKPDTPTLIMLHHHPFDSGIDHMDRQQLRNRHALEELLGVHRNVERVLCGHLHRSIQRRFANTIAHSCPGISHQVTLDLRRQAPATFTMEPPGYLLHHWTPDAGMLTHQGFIDTYPGPYPFFDADGLID